MRLNPIPIVLISLCSWERDYIKLMDLTIELIERDQVIS